jgi:hypothetical protein
MIIDDGILFRNKANYLGDVNLTLNLVASIGRAHVRLEQGWSKGRAWEPISTQKDKYIHGTANWMSTQRLMYCISNLSGNRSELVDTQWDALDNTTTDTSLTLQRWVTALAARASTPEKRHLVS